MLFGIKIGNSTIEIVRFENPSNNLFKSLKKVPLEKVDMNKIFNEIEISRDDDCIVCSTVSSLTEKFLKSYSHLFRNIINIHHNTYTGLTLKVLNPEKFGSDRLTNACAGYELLKENIAIVDGGTATTITIVTKNGDILGGAIMPGIEIMNKCLHEKTDSLPLTKLEESVSPLGRDTHEAIRSGIILGTVHAIRGIVEEISQLLSVDVKIILTGGNGFLISKYLNIYHVFKPSLVFEGMRLIYLKNIKN